MVIDDSDAELYGRASAADKPWPQSSKCGSRKNTGFKLKLNPMSQKSVAASDLCGVKHQTSAADNEAIRQIIDAEAGKEKLAADGARPGAGAQRDFDFVMSRATLRPSRFLELAVGWTKPGARVMLLSGYEEQRNTGSRHVAQHLVLLDRERISGRRASFLSVYERR